MGTNDVITVIYHAQCHDGFAAAVAAHLSFGDRDTRYIAAEHGEPVPEIAGGTVYIFDFSYPLEGMQAIAAAADRLVWLDHHASVLGMATEFDHWLTARGLADRVTRVLDMNHSGAALAWLHLHSNRPLPHLFKHVEDHDLWRWALPGTAGFTSGLADLPYDFAAWEQLLTTTDHNPDAYAEFVRQGEIGHRKYLKLCADIAARAEPVHLDGIRGLRVNAPGEFASHVGNILAEQSGTYGLIWHVREGMVRLSFRAKEGFNVIPLAAQFGGGGHRAAAGARIPLSRLSEILEG